MSCGEMSVHTARGSVRVLRPTHLQLGENMTSTRDPRSVPDRRSWKAKVALLAVFALGAAACGGDDDDADTADSAPDGTEASTTEPSGTEPIWHRTVWRSTDRRSDQGHDRDDAQRRRAGLPEHRQHRQRVRHVHQCARRDRRPAARGHRLRRAVRPGHRGDVRSAGGRGGHGVRRRLVHVLRREHRAGHRRVEHHVVRRVLPDHAVGARRTRTRSRSATSRCTRSGR